MKMKHESAIRAFIQNELPIDVYLEDLELSDEDWVHDLRANFLGRRAAVLEPDRGGKPSGGSDETISDSGSADDDFDEGDSWGPSDWPEFLGCGDDDVDDFFDSLLC